MIGVIIETGPQNWQIVQQSGGYAALELGGYFVRRDGGPLAEVYVRVVREDSGGVVRYWTQAENLHGDRWHLRLERIPAGGLYRVETCLREHEGVHFEDCLRGDMIHNIGVGDLFVLAGQSNSVGYGRDSLSDPPELGVHLLRSSEQWDLATHPLHDSTGTRHPINCDGANTGHSPYLAFGKAMHRALGYPIGLLPCALGGSPLSSWTPEEEGSLYRNMLDIIRSQGGAVRAVAWYQGCTDAMAGGDLAARYLERFAAMVRHLREDLSAPELPIFTFQIGRALVKATDEVNLGWNQVREQQRQAAREIPGVYVLPTLDGMLSDVIHNNTAFNLVLGERLAKQMLSKLYHQPSLCDAPDLESLSWEGPQKLRLTFSYVTDYLYCYGDLPESLPICLTDSAGQLAVAAYTVQGGAIVLELDRPAQGEVTVCCHSGQKGAGHCIVDFANHYPVLAFLQTISAE